MDRARLVEELMAILDQDDQVRAGTRDCAQPENCSTHQVWNERDEVEIIATTTRPAINTWCLLTPIF